MLMLTWEISFLVWNDPRRTLPSKSNVKENTELLYLFWSRYRWSTKKPIRGDYLKGTSRAEPGIFTGKAIGCGEYVDNGAIDVTVPRIIADTLEDTDSE